MILDTKKYKIGQYNSYIAHIVWKMCEECVKVWEKMCESVWQYKIRNPLAHMFHRYLKFQKWTKIGWVMKILSFSHKYIFPTNKLIVRCWIANWGLKSARTKRLKKTAFFIPATVWSQITNSCGVTNLGVKFSKKIIYYLAQPNHNSILNPMFFYVLLESF